MISNCCRCIDYLTKRVKGIIMMNDLFTPPAFIRLPLAYRQGASIGRNPLVEGSIYVSCFSVPLPSLLAEHFPFSSRRCLMVWVVASPSL